MAIVFPETGRKLALDILLRSGAAPKIRLYKNDVTPGAGTVLGTLSEADFSGYAAVDAAFDAADINGDGQGEVSMDDVTFTRDGGVGGANTIYGWYMTRQNLSAADELLFAERFDESVLVENEDDVVKFDLRLFDQIAS